MPTSVLRRYTPPTCTLEVAATGSALSRWTQRPALGNLQFQLSFDDPKLLPDQQVTVKGNQTQLDALYEVVGTYVQSLLGQPAAQMLQGAAPTPWNVASPDVAATVLPEAALKEPPTEVSGLSLQPRGLSHDLHLGTLASAETGPVVRLSTLQLFDLANALEEYHAEALTLPDLGRPTWLQSPNSWTRIAAVSVLALGATAGLAKFVFDIANPTVQTASAPQQIEASSELQTEPVPRLSPPPIEPSPTITLQPVPPLPPEGAAQPGEPGLPPVGNTTPPPPATIPAVPSQSAAVPVPGSAANSPQVTVIPAPEGATDPETDSVSPPNAPAAAPAAPPRLTGVGELDGTGELDSQPSASIARSQAVSPPSPEAATNRSTAFDTIPQVAEVRSFFQGTWQPPSELTQTLEYRLLLNSDGSLQRIVPLGQFSANYIDRTNMPLMGEPFVSPTADGSTPQIRLVLKPDGSVQTFLEYAN